MNRRKNAPRHHASVFFAIIFGIAIAAGGGILHAYYKNRHIQIAREIDAIERRIGQYQLDVQTTRYRTDQLMNRYAMAERLKENSSSLKPIPLLVIEEVDPAPLARNSVATALHPGL